MLVTVIGWMVMGLIAGYFASTLIHKRGERLKFNMVLGMLGAVIGGWLFQRFGPGGVTGFDLWKVLVPLIGAVALLAAGNSARSSHA